MSAKGLVADLPVPLPTKLNVGCGYDIREGYLNVDLHQKHKPDLVADVSDLSMLPEEHFKEIVAQDVLEHLERHKTVPTLVEWARLLRQGARLHLRVPSLFDLFELLANPSWRAIEQIEQVVHLMYGTQAYTGDYHLAGFTARLLSEYLSRAGLIVCRAELVNGCFYDVSARKTDRLTDPIEIAHFLYFTILDRAGDPGGISGLSEEIRAARLDQAGAAGLLRDSEEGRFIASHPIYLRGYLDRFRPVD